MTRSPRGLRSIARPKTVATAALLLALVCFSSAGEAATGGTDVLPPISSISVPLASGEIVSTKALGIYGSASDIGMGGSPVSEVSVLIDGAEPWTPAAIVDGAGSPSVTWSLAWAVPDEDFVSHSLVSRATDAAGNAEIASSSRQVWVDVVAPRVTGFTVADGAEYTGTTTVTLGADVTDGSTAWGRVIEMRLSNDGITWSPWEEYRAVSEWTLAEGDGPKTVWAEFRDPGGNTTGSAVSDGIVLDTSPPVVLSTSPADGEVGVPVTISPTIRVSDPIDPDFLSDEFQLWGDADSDGALDPAHDALIPGSVAYDDAGRAVTLAPSAALEFDTRYFVRVGSEMRNAAGLAQGTESLFAFMTVPEPDTTPPWVVSITPANGATRAPVDGGVAIRFSEPIDPVSVVDSIRLEEAGRENSVLGDISADAEDPALVHFSPDALLRDSTEHSVIVDGDIRDAAGNLLGGDVVTTFRTAAPDDGPHGAYTESSEMCGVCHERSHMGAEGDATDGGTPSVETGQTALCYACHGGGDAGPDVAAEFSAAGSGHEVRDPAGTTLPGTAAECSSCHGAHYVPGEKPALYRTRINDSTVAGNDNTWCQACHDAADSWAGSDYPYPKGGPDPVRPQRDPSVLKGYPVLGTYPGSRAYNDPVYNPHNGAASEGVVWPLSGRASGDCRNCHESHKSEATYDALVARLRPTPDPGAVLSDRRDGTYAELCLTCHDADGPATHDIERFTSYEFDRDGDDFTGGHRISSEGGNLPVGAPLPCYDCHNPHGSIGNDGNRPNRHLISDELWSNIDTSTTAGVVEFCLECHLPWEYVTGSGEPEEGSVPDGQLTSIEGLDRRDARNRLSLPDVGPAHGASNMIDPTIGCYECHGADYSPPSATAGFNVHRPASPGRVSDVAPAGDSAAAGRTGPSGGPIGADVLPPFVPLGSVGLEEVATPSSTGGCLVCHASAAFGVFPDDTGVDEQGRTTDSACIFSTD